MKFKEYKGLDLAGLATEVLNEWDAHDTFHKSISTREGHPTFVFYEGPPSANGMPGIHHVMARTIKDVFCRYKTQQGYLVHRKAGWDTHGLPVELGVEKKLGITKEDIGRKISIEEYNRACREAVMEFTGMWEELTRKMGYWVNMDDPYITYDNKYIESLWWLLKQLFDDPALLAGRRHGALDPRVEPAGLLPRREGHDRRGPVPHHGPQTRDGGLGHPLLPGMDHHAVDPAVEYGALRRPEDRLRGRPHLERIHG